MQLQLPVSDSNYAEQPTNTRWFVTTNSQTQFFAELELSKLIEIKNTFLFGFGLIINLPEPEKGNEVFLQELDVITNTLTQYSVVKSSFESLGDPNQKVLLVEYSKSAAFALTEEQSNLLMSKGSQFKRMLHAEYTARAKQEQNQNQTEQPEPVAKKPVIKDNTNTSGRRAFLNQLGYSLVELHSQIEFKTLKSNPKSLEITFHEKSTKWVNSFRKAAKFTGASVKVKGLVVTITF